MSSELIILAKFLESQEGLPKLIDLNSSGRENMTGNFIFDISAYKIGNINWF